MSKRKKKSTRVSRPAGSKTYNPTIEKREAKKEAVLGTAAKKNRLPIVVFSICAILIAGGIFFYNSQTGVKPSPDTTHFSAAATDSQVTFPAALFEDGKARHFEHVDGNFTIRYFILKSSDGIIRAAFDACDVCWPAAKGYFQDGDYMVCRNCGRRFASVLVNEVKGGCNPAPLNRVSQDGKVIIQVKDILEGKQYFNFS
ncbi:MAG: DUF2318 domain-containing protein [Desulfobacterales bacterium]|jgi:uncharacterized membrane protein